MRILVTGHKGFIGSSLMSALCGHRVIGYDLKDGLFGDARYARERVDVVYHLAAQSSVLKSVDNPLLDCQANIVLTLKLIEQYPDAKFIYTGSGGASEQEHILSPYGLSKKVAGEYLKMLHKNYVICNLPNVYGKGGNGVIERFQREEILTINGDGRQTRDFVHVSDVVRGLVQAKWWDKGEYNLGSGKSVRVIDIAKAIGKPIQFAPPNPFELTDANLANTTPDWQPTVNLMDYLKQEQELPSSVARVFPRGRNRLASASSSQQL